jgi:hypothetical protein
MSNLIIKKGNPYECDINFNSSGAVYDLTGKSVLFTVKDIGDMRSDDNSALIQKDIITHINQTAGKTHLSLTATETAIPAGVYKWDLRIYQAGIVQANTESGICEIRDIVTKRTS